MKKILMATALLASAAVATPSLAADLGRRAPVYKAPPPAPIFTWTGFYAGVNAGYTFGNDRDTITTGIGAANINAVADGARPPRVRLDRDGFIGGGQIGYNMQFGSWVAGIEADIQYSDVRDTVNAQTTLAVAGLNGTAAGTRNNFYSTKMEYFGTVRGRLGYAWDRTLIYATGGLAYGEITNAATFTGVGPAFANQFFGSRRRTDTGYTVGGGIEHAFAPNWTVKAEYLYYDLGDTTVPVLNLAGPAGAGGPGYNARFQNEGHIVRAGLNYKFGGGLFGGL